MEASKYFWCNLSIENSIQILTWIFWLLSPYYHWNLATEYGIHTIILHDLAIIDGFYEQVKSFVLSKKIDSCPFKDLVLGALEFNILVKRGKERTNLHTFKKTCFFFSHTCPFKDLVLGASEFNILFKRRKEIIVLLTFKKSMDFILY